MGLGVFATAAAPSRSLITSAPQARPQVQYTVIELGGRRANDISQSGQIVGSKECPHPGSSMPHFGPAAGARRLISAHCLISQQHRRGLEPSARDRGILRLAKTSLLSCLCFGQALTVHPSNSPVCRTAFRVKCTTSIHQARSSASSLARTFQWTRRCFGRRVMQRRSIFAQLSDDFPLSGASGINASGNILGDACDANFVECHAAFWATSTSTPVALASPGGEFIYTDFVLPGHAINGAGNMVGFARNADFSAERAVFWASNSSPAVILSTVGEFTNAVAAGISDNGQIVGIGYNEDFSKERPFLWPSATSQGIDLTTFFPPGSNWDLDSMFAVTVNNRGEIVGSGLFTDGTVHNFVLIPVHGH